MAADRRRRLTFNVGGIRFETSVETVNRHPQSMLATLVNGEWSTPDEDGSWFIDRSPMYFTLVLDWMRTDLVPALPPGIGVRNLISEARFYLLDRMVHDLEHLLFRPTRYELYQMMQQRDLSHVDLSDMNLRGKDFHGFKLDYTNLAGADLTEADLTMASLHGSDLTGATLEGAILRGADFTDACLQGASLRKAILSHATKFFNANLQQADVAQIEGFSDANWASSSL